MSQSILDTIKKLLDIDTEFSGFDVDVLTAINTAISILNQIGVGEQGFYTLDRNALWEDFVDLEKYPMVVSYIHLRTRLIFDPPTNSFTIQSIEKMIDEMTWRLRTIAESEEV